MNNNKRLIETTIRLKSTKDRLGRRIDNGIFETVVVLNTLGINTTASCAGHIRTGVAAPWVDIERQTDMSLRLTKKMDNVLREADKINNNPNSSKKKFASYHKLRSRLKKEKLTDSLKLLDYLSEFYFDRQIEYRVRLILYPYGHGTARLQSLGADFQEILPIQQRKNNLIKYREEMKCFTIFLRDKYLSSG